MAIVARHILAINCKAAACANLIPRGVSFDLLCIACSYLISKILLVKDKNKGFNVNILSEFNYFIENAGALFVSSVLLSDNIRS